MLSETGNTVAPVSLTHCNKGQGVEFQLDGVASWVLHQTSYGHLRAVLHCLDNHLHSSWTICMGGGGGGSVRVLGC